MINQFEGKSNGRRGDNAQLKNSAMPSGWILREFCESHKTLENLTIISMVPTSESVLLILTGELIHRSGTEQV